MTDQNTQPDKPDWVIIYEDDLVRQEYSEKQGIVLSFNKKNPPTLSVIYKRRKKNENTENI